MKTDRKREKGISLRRQILTVILICWFIPFIMLLTFIGWSLNSTVGEQGKGELETRLQLQLQMCAERLDTAVVASRLASYDTTIRDAWNVYLEDGSYAALYRTSHAFLNRQYQSDSRFLYAVFWFSEDPEDMQLISMNSSLGGIYRQISQWWQEDFPAAQEMAEELDTAVGFLECGGRVYLVRNLKSPSYETIGVLVLALNLPYYFDDLAAMTWASPVEVSINDSTLLRLRGDAPITHTNGCLSVSQNGNGYTLSAEAALDYAVLLNQLKPFIMLLGAMLCLVIPLLLLTFRFFRSRISAPVDALLAGARRIEQGELGYQVSYTPDTTEFKYLTESFNSMSGRLRTQFDRLYREELAVRDAQIKALQAHINPHFLNNTLETISWEARINGDTKASQMIEALSTVLDAALDRKSSPEVTLTEELHYVNAYLFIITQRFGDRLTIRQSIPEELLGCRVPRLILQPVIENAVEHGIRPNGKGEVYLSAFREGSMLILEVTNDGGLSEEDEALINRLLSDNYDPSSESSGNIGIANVNRRLRILYGNECGLSIRRGEGSTVRARLSIAIEQ